MQRFWFLTFLAVCYLMNWAAASSCQKPLKVQLTNFSGCPADPGSSRQSLHPSNKQQCAMLCAKQSWCAALGFSADSTADGTDSPVGVCRLFTAETALLGWNASCRGQAALASRDRLDSFKADFLTIRNVTQKRLYIPRNSVKIFSAWLQPQPAASSLIDCVARCSEAPACRGILFNSSSCSLLTDYPLCRWFQQPANSSELDVYEFHTVGAQQCFETVNLRLSDKLDFNRLWADYKAGFGAYHDNYFVGLEWLHTRTSAQPNGNRLRVDLLYWNETYIYGYYLNVLVLSESTNYTVSAFTFEGTGGLKQKLFYRSQKNLQFVTRDRGYSYEVANCTSNCALTFNPHWHGCCHYSGPFGKYFNYPTALNVPNADRAQGIVWTGHAPSNCTDQFFYSFKQLEILMLT